MANSNSFLSPYENLRLAQENKYLGKFLFYHEIVCCVYSLESPYRGDSNEYTQHAIDVKEIKQKSLNYRYLLPDTMINPQWLELPKSRTIFYGPKDVRAIEVRLYVLYVYRFLTKKQLVNAVIFFITSMDAWATQKKDSYVTERWHVKQTHIQSTLVISKSKGLSEILRDIRTSTYQICRIEEKLIRLTTFNKYIQYILLKVC